MIVTSVSACSGPAPRRSFTLRPPFSVGSASLRWLDCARSRQPALFADLVQLPARIIE